MSDTKTETPPPYDYNSGTLAHDWGPCAPNPHYDPRREENSFATQVQTASRRIDPTQGWGSSTLGTQTLVKLLKVDESIDAKRIINILYGVAESLLETGSQQWTVKEEDERAPSGLLRDVQKRLVLSKRDNGNVKIVITLGDITLFTVPDLRTANRPIRSITLHSAKGTARSLDVNKFSDAAMQDIRQAIIDIIDTEKKRLSANLNKDVNESLTEFEGYFTFNSVGNLA